MTGVESQMTGVESQVTGEQVQSQLMHSRSTSEYLDLEEHLQSLSRSLLRSKSATFRFGCLSFRLGLLLPLVPLSLLFCLMLELFFPSYPFKSLGVLVRGKKGVLLLGEKMLPLRSWSDPTRL
jgi:hypothetical protein